MTRLIPEEGDASEFVASVASVFRGVAKAYVPPELIVVKVDNWFGSNWLRFSGKALGALGVWKRKLTIPPFVPNRVVWQRRFSAPSYEEVASDPAIHVATSGEGALSRREPQGDLGCRDLRVAEGVV